MVANPKFTAALAHVDDAAIQPLPHSRKIYARGSRADIRVPMREIAQADTPASFGAEKNPPIFVYDTSGPYTDPEVRIDIRQGLARSRGKWIAERGDTEELGGPTSAYGRERLDDPKLAEMRFDLKRRPRLAKKGLAVTQMHYARRGVVTPEMEYIAIRENVRRKEYLDSLRAAGPTGAKMAELIGRQHRGQSFGAAAFSSESAEITPEFVRDEVARGRAIIPANVNHPGERADDHRPQLPHQDQRQHRQLGGDLGHRRGSGQDDLGDPLGRRHGHGPLDRAEHPRDARVDHPQLAGADRHGADLPGAREGERPGGSAHLGDLPRHADRAGGAGRRLLHHPRRGAPALHPAHREADDRHRLARRLDHGEVVPRAPRGELPLHALRRNLRNHARVRRLVLARRRPASGLDLRRKRRGAARGAAHAGRAHEGRLGARLPGDDRRPRPRPDAAHQGEHGARARAIATKRRSTRSDRSRPTSRPATTTSPARSARR